MSAWPEPVERVTRFLRESGAEARVEQFAGGTPTAEDAARAAGAKLEQIVKSLVFVCDGRNVLALIPGDRRADSARVAAAAGARRARIADAKRVEEATGFTPGSVAPFPLRSVQMVLIERRLLVHQHVWIGAGSPQHLAMVTPDDLVRLSRGRTADLVQQGAGPGDPTPAG